MEDATRKDRSRGGERGELGSYLAGWATSSIQHLHGGKRRRVYKLAAPASSRPLLLEPQPLRLRPPFPYHYTIIIRERILSVVACNNLEILKAWLDTRLEVIRI